MAPRPRVRLGDYIRAIDHPTIRCNQYTAPLWDGDYLETLAPGSVLGPIDAISHQDVFMTVRIDGTCINIWRAHRLGTQANMEARGTAFASWAPPPPDPAPAPAPDPDPESDKKKRKRN